MGYVRLLHFLFLFLIISEAFAQQEAFNWVFGEGIGMAFPSGEPVASSGYAIKSVDGSAVVSDSITGELLFYTDGRNFWNRKHERMPDNFNPTSGICYTTITQPALIIPSKVYPGIYHVFCVRASPENPTPSNSTNCVYTADRSRLPDNHSGLSLYYNRINMTLNDGLGGIAEDHSNILIESNVVQKLTAIPHANGSDYWIIVHGWLSNRFFVYQFSEGAITRTQTWDIGSIHGAYGGIYFEDELRGELKPSPNGKKLASAVFSEDRPFDLFDFDNSSGTIYNYVSLGDVSGQYGTSFSPDNSKLYVSSDSRTITTQTIDIILQYDLSVNDPSAIKASVNSIIVGNPSTNLPPNGIIDGWSTAPKGMTLAIDGRLYITGNEPRDGTEVNNILVVVDKPNSYGYACGVNYRRFNFDEGKTGVGLPNFIQNYFNGLESSSICRGPSSITVFPNPTSGEMNIDIMDGCRNYDRFEIIDSLGKRIALVANAGNKIDLSHLASGLYFVLFYTAYRTKVVKKIIRL